MTCVGVIFHFNPDGVLFEFPAGKNDDAVGIVKPQDIKINSRETIPGNATTVEHISKFLQVGDELLCHVERRGDIEKFVYNEEEEELSSDGKTKTVTRKVEIQPRWVATSAELVTDDNRSKKETFSTLHAEKGHDELDYDDDDLIIIEDVDMSDFEEEKKNSEGNASSEEAVKGGQTNSVKAQATEETKKSEAPAPPKLRQIVKVLAPVQKNKVAKGGQETFKDKARLVQLRKPPLGSTGKVTSGVFEITSGHLKGRNVSVPNVKMKIFGHSLSSANLMLNLKYGEVCTIEYRVARLKSSQDFLAEVNHSDVMVEVPLAVSLWFGTETNAPVAMTDKSLTAWLNEKKINPKGFLDWLKNFVAPKPYFPFMSATKLGKVIRYIRGPDASVIGVLLEVGGESAKQNQPSFAILLNSDFYICGVCILNADLSVFLNLGDSVSCQLRPLTNGDVVLMQHLLFQARDLKVTRVAELGMIGPNRPTQANLAPAHAPMLDKYLASKKMSLEEFERMRYRNFGGPDLSPSSHTPQGFAPMMMRHPMMMTAPFGVPPFGIRPIGPLPVMTAGPGVPPPGNVAPGPHPQLDNAPLPPPNLAFPGVFGPFLPRVPIQLINVATNIAARAVNIDSDDMRIRNLLHNTGEMEVAAKIAKNLIQSLLHKLQSNVQMRLNQRLPSLPDLKKQIDEVEKILQSLSGPVNANPQAGDEEQTPPLTSEGKLAMKRAGSVPNDPGSKQPRLNETDKSIHSRLGPPLQSLSMPPPPIPATLDPLPLNGSKPRGPLIPLQPVAAAASQLNPLPVTQTSNVQQPQMINSFSNPREQADVNRWSPTYQRIQEMNQNANRSSNAQSSSVLDKPIGSTMRETTLKDIALKDRQLEQELEQERLWQEYLREKESRLRMEEEKERAKLAEEARKKEHEAEEMKRFLAEQDRLRQKMKKEEEDRRLREEEERLRIMAEVERERIRKEEMERQRQRQEQERKEEEERRKFKEEQERKRKEEAERQRLREEQERKRREEAERQRLREEQERKRREEAERQRIREELERQRIREEQERKKKEEMERMRIREEQERKRRENLERQRVQEEMERKRKAELEIQRIREEQDRLLRDELERVREEEKEKTRKAIEQERLRIRQEEMRKMKEESDRLHFDLRHQQELENSWKSEMQMRLRKQQEEDERDRKAREMNASATYGSTSFGNQYSGGPSSTSQRAGITEWMNNPPPPPKLTGMYDDQNSDNRAKPDAQGGGGLRKSDVFGDKIPFRSGSQERSDVAGGSWNQSNRESMREPQYMNKPPGMNQGNYPMRSNAGPQSAQQPNYGVPPPQQSFITGRSEGYNRRY